MFFGSFFIIDSRKQQIPMIVFQCLYIPFFFYLRDRTAGGFVPFQFDDCCRFVCMQFPRDEADVGEAFSWWQFSDDGVVFSRKIEGKIVDIAFT